MSPDYDSKDLSEGIDKFASCRILVVGDVILDEYLLGRVDRISPEDARKDDHIRGRSS